MFSQRCISQLAFVFLAVLFTGVGLSKGQTPITGTPEPCTDGQAAGRYPCKDVDLKSYLPIGRLGGTANVKLNDIWGWRDPQTGSRYALVGRTDGVAFVDVSTPTEPVYIGDLPTHSRESPWRDVKVHEDHAYIVSEAPKHGLQVFDLNRLRSVNDPPVTFSETAHYDRFGTAHNVVVNEETGYAYAVGLSSGQEVPPSANCGPGLHIIDLSTPDQPEFAGCYTNFSSGANGYTHDAQCTVYQGPDADYNGREICFNANEEELNIADVTDKSEPETITTATYPNSGYVHQAWLTKDQKYLLVDDELDEDRSGNGIDSTRTLVFDVTDLDNPELAERFTGETTAIDHNQYVVGNYSYQANYTAGLRILDVSRPEVPEEVAYFDTFPASNTARFAGAWSVYPFFGSGIALVSSIGQGLFVLQPALSPILNPRVTVQNRTATVKWRISSSVATRKVTVERSPPETSSWMVEKTRLNAPRHEAANLQVGIHQFRIRHVATNGDEYVSDPIPARVLPDDQFEISGLPNPIQKGQTLTLISQTEQNVQVGLYDVLGRRVLALYDGMVEAGERMAFTLAPPASGIYFLRVEGEGASTTRKVVVAQ